jgi:2,3-dihydroxyphenylpropionate 1,2-dioxygenase
MSHSPLFGYELSPVPKARQETEVTKVLADLSARVEAFTPDLVILIGPDHFQGFFYANMPTFCIGVRAEAAGDYGGPSGVVRTDEAAATACAEFLHAAGFDPAISYAMRLDHGYTQPLTHLLGGIASVPVIPIYINAVAPPRASLSRVRSFGAALGRWASSLNRRVLLIGSGGLSHDPPVPAIGEAPPAVQDFLISGAKLSAEERRARESGIVEQAVAFGHGDSPLQPLNPDWDRWLLERFAAGELDDIAKLSDADVTRDGGRAGHEIRTWLAACAALGSDGPYDAEVLYYAPVPEWLVAAGIMEGAPSA